MAQIRSKLRFGLLALFLLIVAAISTDSAFLGSLAGQSCRHSSGAAIAPDDNAIPVYVHATMLADTKEIIPGKPFRLGVELVMDPGWHTYYLHSGEAGMPSKIEWELPAGFKASSLMWEKPHKFNDSDIVTFGYSDRTVLASTIEAPAGLKPGQKIELKAKVKWLSCKDICVPGSAPVQLTLPVAAAGAKAQADNVDKFKNVNFDGPTDGIKEDPADAHGAPKADGKGIVETGVHILQSKLSGDGEGNPTATTPGEPGSTPANSTVNAGGTDSGTGAGTDNATTGGGVLSADYKVDGGDTGKAGLLAYLGFAFIGGFILNFMPCVLPVISIKVFSLIQQAGEDPKRVFQHGITFMLGIVLSFLTLGLLVIAIQGAGQKVGWGFQFQYPLFVLAMANIVTLFALSMFGVFYVNVTAGQQQIDKLASSEGLGGTFFKGVLATLLSTPCTAPFLGTALGFAFAQPWWEILTVFFVIGLGMSSPYLALALRPDWMKFLPKPGTWMERFKESMGFLLLATAVWLIWVLLNQVGVDAGMSAVAFLVCLSFAAWIIGNFVDLTSDNNRRFTVWTIALAVIGAGYAGFLRPFPELLSFSPATTKTSNKGRSEGAIKWVNFSLSELDKQLKDNKTVFIDFTADWCLTCKANEQTVINTAPVIEKLKQLNVVPMKADWTAQDPEISKLLAKFGRSGVPVYVIYPAGKPTQPILLPEVISQSIVLEGLDKAGPSK